MLNDPYSCGKRLTIDAWAVENFEKKYNIQKARAMFHPYVRIKFLFKKHRLLCEALLLKIYYMSQIHSHKK